MLPTEGFQRVSAGCSSFDRPFRATITGEIIAVYRSEIKILVTGRLYATRYLDWFRPDRGVDNKS